MRNLIAIAVVATAVLARPVHAATLEDILAKNLAARGGEAKLRDIKSLRITGRLIFGGGDFSVEAAWGQVQKRGNGSGDGDLVRGELTVQGLTQIQAYDGHDGWTISPFGGRLDAEKASDDDARGLAQQAELDGPLINWRAKGHRIESIDSFGPTLDAAFKQGGVHLVVIPIDYSENVRVLVDELRARQK